MAVKKECQHLLAINTYISLFQYTRLPFQISTAPSLWQKAMAQVLQGLSGVVCYISNILVTGYTRAEHKDNLIWQTSSLWLACQEDKTSGFFCKQLEFLVHISNDGIKPTEERIRSSTSSSEQARTSLISWDDDIQCKFLPSLILYPLYLLLSKNSKWAWRSKQYKAFEAAKQLLCKQGTLVL